MNHWKEKRIVVDEDSIQRRVKELGEEITRDYQDKQLILICMLKGSLYFFADLSRAIKLDTQLDFIAIGIYPNSTSLTGAVRITKDLDIDITGKHVLIIEDIIRSGLTTGYLVQNLETRKAASVKVCTLLLNPKQQLISVPIAYSGFDVSDAFLMGYGLDVNENGRSLPYIVEIEK